MRLYYFSRAKQNKNQR